MTRRNFYGQSLVDAKRAEWAGRAPRADCPTCGRDVAVYWPKGGDGSVRITVWHKRNPKDWCRAELGVEHVIFTDTSGIGLPARPARPQAGIATGAS